VNTPVLEKV